MPPPKKRRTPVRPTVDDAPPSPPGLLAATFLRLPTHRDSSTARACAPPRRRRAAARAVRLPDGFALATPPFAEQNVPPLPAVVAALADVAPPDADVATPGLALGSVLWDSVLYSATLRAEECGADPARRLPLCAPEHDDLLLMRMALSNAAAFQGAARACVLALESWVTRCGELATVDAGNVRKDKSKYVIEGVSGGGLLAEHFGWDLQTESVGKVWSRYANDAKDDRTFRERRDSGRGYSLVWQAVRQLPAHDAPPRADLEGPSGYVLLLNLGERALTIETAQGERVSIERGQLLLVPGATAYRAADAADAASGAPLLLLRALLVSVEYELFEHDGVTAASRAASSAHNRALPPFPTYRRPRRSR